MEWDLGLLGLATVLVMALGFGLLAQLLAGRAPYLQPNIDGLSL